MYSSNEMTVIQNKNDWEISLDPDPVKWEAFIETFPGAAIFQSRDMRDLLNAIPGNKAGSIALLERGAIKGILVYSILKEKGWKGAFSKRCIVHGGPLVSENDQGVLDQLIRQLVELALSEKAIYTEIRNNWPLIPDPKTLSKQGFVYKPHLNILIDLTQEEKNLIHQMHPKRAANIRRARKKEVNVRQIVSEEEWVSGYNLIQKTYRRVNLPAAGPELFLNLRKQIPDKSKLFAAFLGKQMIAARFYLLSGDILYDWYAGSDEKYHRYQPNDLLPWEVMKWAKRNGFSTYDFGGAGRPGIDYGVRTYKERFGGRLVEPGRFQLVHRTFLFKLGQWGIRFYKFIRMI
ncbi:MAG: peptidoglycan bridge formation glycyltransferase FemA/FemB family protein [Chitinophagales bacterium]|nr:peptidoglycan bridge formation glycyltransferase FemA/FemB family protein [Chitinophagales bacterium]